LVPWTRSSDATTWRNFICKSSHPVAAFFHIAFKSAALVLYLLGGVLLRLDYVTTFVFSILLLSFDFWAVKNITGRLLVGLRWWSHTKDDGSTEWVFESHPNTAATPAIDRRIFWLALYLAPASWAALALVAFVRFNFEWLLVDMVGAALTGANLVGYTKCSSDAQKRLQATLASGAMQGLRLLPTGALPALGSTMLSFLTGGGAAAAAGGATAPAAPGAGAGAAGGRQGGTGLGDEDRVTI
jgi:hypothetical protein